MDDPSPGARIGPHEMVGPLGTGGMGQACDARLGREVAIKLSKEKFSERFEREVEERCKSLRGARSETSDMVKWRSEACESGREAAERG